MTQQCRRKDCHRLAEYFVSPESGQRTRTGLCRECYEKQIFRRNQTDHSLDGTDKHQRTKGHGYTGGTGYKALHSREELERHGL